MQLWLDCDRKVTQLWEKASNPSLSMYNTKEAIPIQKVTEACERLIKPDVKYCFSIDIASLKSEKPVPF